MIGVLDGLLDGVSQHGIDLSHMNEEEREEAKLRYVCISQTMPGSVKAEKTNRKVYTGNTGRRVIEKYFFSISGLGKLQSSMPQVDMDAESLHRFKIR